MENEEVKKTPEELEAEAPRKLDVEHEGDEVDEEVEKEEEEETTTSEEETA